MAMARRSRGAFGQLMAAAPLVAASSVVALLATTAAHAQVAVAESVVFQGKQVRFIVGSPVGGGYDTYGRFFARHLSAFLPGNPAVVVSNMPGGAGITAANYMFTQAPGDGTVICLAPGTITTAPLFGVSGPRYDARKLTWIGSMNSEVAVAVSWKDSPVKTAQDVMRQELVVGGVQATDATVVYPNVLNKILGTRFKVVPGYHGTSEAALAVERGEVQGIGSWNYSSLVANKPDWLSERKVNVLLQIALRHHPDLAATPSVLDLARTDESRALLKLIFAQLTMGRPIFGPPTLGAEPTGILRNAFDAMMKDAQFLANARAERIDLIDPLSGESVQRLINEVYSADPQLVRTAAQMLQ